VTKRKETGDGPYSRLELAQYRLRKIAVDLLDGAALSSDDRYFLIGAFWGIGKGDDSNVMLGVKAKRGERKTPEQVAKRDKMRFALSWIAAAMRPAENGGLGMSLDDAIASAAKKKRGKFIFGLSGDTLRTYWKSHPEWHSPSFPRPLSSLPDPGRGKKLR
jgi:hypothetical protein